MENVFQTLPCGYPRSAAPTLLQAAVFMLSLEAHSRLPTKPGTGHGTRFLFQFRMCVCCVWSGCVHAMPQMWRSSRQLCGVGSFLLCWRSWHSGVVRLAQQELLRTEPPGQPRDRTLIPYLNTLPWFCLPQQISVLVNRFQSLWRLEFSPATVSFLLLKT